MINVKDKELSFGRMVANILASGNLVNSMAWELISARKAFQSRVNGKTVEKLDGLEMIIKIKTTTFKTIESILSKI